MHIDFLLEKFAACRDHDAIVWDDKPWSYGWLLDRIHEWQRRIVEEKIAPGAVVMIEADFSPDSVALWLALAGRSCVIVPLTRSVAAKKEEFTQIAEGEVIIEMNDRDEVSIRRTGQNAAHPLYA